MTQVIVQELFKQFSFKVLYMLMIWFMTFGYFMNMLVLMALTKLPCQDVRKSAGKIQLVSVAISYVLAPFFAEASTLLLMFFAMYNPLFIGQQVYIWFVVSMMFLTSFLLCESFVTVSCRQFRMWIMSTNLIVGVLGFFVLKGLHLITCL